MHRITCSVVVRVCPSTNNTLSVSAKGTLRVSNDGRCRCRTELRCGVRLLAMPAVPAYFSVERLL